MVKINLRRLQIARTGFEDLTKRFRDYCELPADVYKQLKNFGVEISTSYLLDWFPEGVDVFTVKLLLSDGTSKVFSVSPKDPEAFECYDKTNSFSTVVRKSKQKPWVRETIAWEAYLAESIGAEDQ